MPRIFDNIDLDLLPALQNTLEVSERADFCVGYFNLRGWKSLDSYVEKWAGGPGQCCRLIVGMQRLPQEELRNALSLLPQSDQLDNQTVIRLKKKLAQEFRDQLTIGAPNSADEAGLRRLAAQLKSNKLVVKLFLRHALHAKLYLLFRQDYNNPIVGFVGSSNLTFSGLSNQGELNVDVVEHDATEKLAKWFNDRWDDRWAIDISAELIDAIEQSWARSTPIPPYHIYVKMAYHLAEEARSGLSEFSIPQEFSHQLFEFQKAAVKIAAHHVNKRNGVVIGDVVGLGKTLMASALAKMLQEAPYFLETLIICPKNLVPMWEGYVHRYRLVAKIVSITRVGHELPNLRRYRVVLIDESHNLRNREGGRYRIIHEYLQKNDCKCILLSATPYNKTYLDLSNQLRLFVPEDKDLGIRPERLVKEIGEVEFNARHQCPIRSLAAFEKSDYTDDWRELMRLFMVRRTRTFIQNNYATLDSVRNQRYLTFHDGRRSYFPKRIPKTVTFRIDEKNPEDQYARLYDTKIVDVIRALNLPRYGLGNYVAPSPHQPPGTAEAKQLDNLSRAGRRLMGFCRINLFKRLESSGAAFLLSIERHILRNYIFIHALENKKPLPIGTQDTGLLDTRVHDEDDDSTTFGNGEESATKAQESTALRNEKDFRARAADIYSAYVTQFKNHFDWVRHDLFVDELIQDLKQDAENLMGILKLAGDWNPEKDSKLEALRKLLTKTHGKQKVLLFSQFADTVRYLESQLKPVIKGLEGVTGEDDDPTGYAWRFSPKSNDKRAEVAPENEIRVLLATDVLSEGQNLQDGAVIVNFDLPWAIIRLVQRAGRVDRIGQESEEILCYSFLPAEGVERIIRLRARVRQRLTENAEVVGTDEAFFEDDTKDQTIRDLFTEKSGILDDEGDTEVDLASFAYQIWKNAIDKDPSLQKTIPELPSVVYSAKNFTPPASPPDKPGAIRPRPGVLVYLCTAEGNDSLAWMDNEGCSVTESQYEILKAAECVPETPTSDRAENHFDLVQKGIDLVVNEQKSVGGQLGRKSGARYRTYERLKRYAEMVKGSLFDTAALQKAIEEIYKYPFFETATDLLNRQMRNGISDERLAELVIALRDDNRLCNIQEDDVHREPRVICSLGMRPD